MNRVSVFMVVALAGSVALSAPAFAGGWLQQHVFHPAEDKIHQAEHGAGHGASEAAKAVEKYGVAVKNGAVDGLKDTGKQAISQGKEAIQDPRQAAKDGTEAGEKAGLNYLTGAGNNS